VILSTDLTSCKPFREEKAEKNGQGRRSRGALGGKPLISNEERVATREDSRYARASCATRDAIRMK
jgi:hypothetical protein